MLEVIAYQTSDGELFTDDHKAKEHQENLLGEALDDLLPYDDRGNITRADRTNVLIKQMEDPSLKQKMGLFFISNTIPYLHNKPL